jgi:hypothetical protein
MADEPVSFVEAPPPGWTLQDGIALCTAIHEMPSQKFNCHPALTGGLLYKTGPRKDCDIVIYQRGDVNGVREPIDWPGFWLACEAIGLHLFHDFGYVKKCRYRDKWVDVFDPTQDSGNYQEATADEAVEVAA